MRAFFSPGILALVVGYLLSQFYRAFLAVLAPVLETDLGASKEDLASASGVWFLMFAVMQIPVGSALDRVGPRLTTAACLAIGAAGAALFAAATTPLMLTVAMALIGVGCSPVLMASYYLYARQFSPAVFGTLAGVTIGIGSLGNIAASLPLTMAAEAFGWRPTVAAMAAITALAAAGIAALVRDPPRAAAGPGGSVLAVLKMPAIWPILAVMFVCYAPAAGLRGLWLGPYFTDVFGYAQPQIGQAGLWMGLAMVAGSFAYGPLDRWLGTRKWVIFGGNFALLACLCGLFLWAGDFAALSILLLVGVGFFGSTFPIVIAHSRAFFPPHLMGRGVTLVNLFGIASAGLAQVATGKLHAALALPGGVTNSAPPATPYAGLFAFYAVAVAAGLTVYLWSQDRTD